MFTKLTSLIFNRRVKVFIIAGLIGFSIEVLIIYLGTNYLKMGPSSPRLISYPLALFITWKINRIFGFQVEEPANLKEITKYAFSNILAQGLNLSSYFLLVSLTFLSNLPTVALVCSTLLSMFISFVCYAKFAFPPPIKPQKNNSS